MVWSGDAIAWAVADSATAAELFTFESRRSVTASGAMGMGDVIASLCLAAEKSVHDSNSVLIHDRNAGTDRIAIPDRLAPGG